MQTQTRRKRRARTTGAITPSTPALITIRDVARRAVVARTYNALVAHQDTADAAFHAVTAQSGQAGELHEVSVPTGPEALFVEEVGGEDAEGGVEV